MYTTHTFHLPFGEITITWVDFDAITRLLFRGRSVVFDDWMRTLDHPGSRVSLQAAIRVEHIISDQKVKFGAATTTTGLGCHQAIQLGSCCSVLFVLWHGTVRPRSALEDLAFVQLRGDVSARTLPRGRAWRYSGMYSHTTSNVAMFRQLLNGSSWDRDIAVDQRGSAATDYLATFVLGTYAVFVWTKLLVHIPPLTKFDPFIETEELDRGQGTALVQLCPRVFYPQIVLYSCSSGKRVSRVFERRALDTAVIVSTPEHEPGTLISFILDRISQTAQGMLETHLVSPYRMSPPGCTHMSNFCSLL
ncbi:hypothetical protein JCGZ_17152 [Jatropha curcas]|uniref:Aminotransferase-like plant mobile domain-containing protein n=1 Tax=Jatropha curcas TaxID=180498 RepID=A0A067K2E9_JATCU|nr:hypothetical protein JCGZ_17152 [Jatropha curcas]